MKGSYNIIIYDPAEIIYVLTPKCGSTTMIKVFMDLAGIESKGRPIRKEKGEARAEGLLTAKGLRIERCTREILMETRERYPGYKIMANVRCPYERILSNYYNKLNRFTAHFARRIHFYGKFRQFLGGPASWKDVESGNRHMQRRLSFEDFLRGLELHGTDFDVHYAPQFELLVMDRILFDRLVRLEHLQTELACAMEDCGIGPESLRRIQSLPRFNASLRDERRSTLMTPDAKEIISRLYAGDFSRLGYAGEPPQGESLPGS